LSDSTNDENSKVLCSSGAFLSR